MNWPDQRLCALLKIEHPIIQAPMAGATSPALAAAVTGAGGLGSLGCAMLTREGLRDQVEASDASFDELHAWITDHLQDDLRVERLAERCGMSPRNFHRSSNCSRCR